MTGCAVRGCRNSTDKKEEGNRITLHQFPADPILAARWVETIRLNRNEPYWKHNKSTKICSVHFDDKVKYTTELGLCRLRRGAEPTQKLHMCHHIEIQIKIEPEEDLNYHEPSIILDTNDDEIIKTSSPTPVQQKLNRHKAHNRRSSERYSENYKEPSAILDAKEDKILKISSPSPKSQDDSLDQHDSDTESMFDTPKMASLRIQLKRQTSQRLSLSKQIKTLKQRVRRLEKKTASLKTIVKILKKKRYLDKDFSNMLSGNLFAAELFNNVVKKTNKHRKRPMPLYTPQFRKFCLKLYFYSPRAYSYVRRVFSTCLPHPKTVYNWVTNIDGTAGLSEETIKLFKSRVQRIRTGEMSSPPIADKTTTRPHLPIGEQESSDKATNTDLK